MNLRFITSLIFCSAILTAGAQTLEEKQANLDALQPDKPMQQQDTVKTAAVSFKVDGVAGVVGDFIILDSDVAKTLETIQQDSQGGYEDVSECEIMGKLLEDKLYAHMAIQDSVTVDEGRVRSYTQQQIEYLKGQLGSQEKMLQFYRKESVADLEKELYELNRNQQLGTLMQQKVVEEVEITPDEVRQFFESIPKEERPLIGVELEISQIVIEPEIPQEEVQKVLDELNGYRRDVLDNGSSFASRAVLYSQDPGSAREGGLMTLTRTDPFVKEFKDVAFSLQEGEVSEPFETEFGYHILTVDRIRGQRRDVRHILRIPNVTQETVKAAKEKIDDLRTRLVAGELDFAEAAREFSDEKETRSDGGALINPQTGDRRFELTNVDSELYAQIQDLKEGEISAVFNDPDRTGRVRYKILKVTNRFDEHVADYAKDYVKIKELALTDKRVKAIKKWQDDKITDTYVKINGKYRDCEFAGNWVKQ
ncbi:peptidylprolyl isomerase [Croceiramulus getboli]|nr:peptidylprolyl isomerase [Flavobacteriaceae bacterium YJPT1-3]